MSFKITCKEIKKKPNNNSILKAQYRLLSVVMDGHCSKYYYRDDANRK